MSMPPPEMAKKDTMLFRHITRFHDNFIGRLSNGSKDTLRSTAWQLDAFIQENKKYKDVEYLTNMLRIIEWVIQKKFGTNWTVARAKKDLRGRTRGVNQHKENNPVIHPKPVIPTSLKKALETRITGVKV
jgi:hypothetical protein